MFDLAFMTGTGRYQVGGTKRDSKRAKAAGYLLAALFTLLACGGQVDEAPSEYALACYASCDRQKEGCKSLDLQGCRSLCDFAIKQLESKPGCLEKARPTWECGMKAPWVCSSETNIVGELGDSSCNRQIRELEQSGCQPM